MNESGHWVHNLDPKLIHIWGDIGVSYYGLAYVLAFVFAVALHRVMLRKNRSPIKREDEEMALYALVLGVLIGARLGYCVLYALPEFLQRPLFIVEVWNGGMSFHGGVIGVLAGSMYVAWRTKTSLLRFGDMIVSMAPFGLFIGRIANFINGELWGKVSDIAWAVVFPRSEPGVAVEYIAARHPSQLYEAALEGAVLLLWLQFRFWKTSAPRYPGKISGEFLMLYAVFRMFCEVFREPDASLVFGLSRGTFYSLFILIAGIFLWVRAYKRGPIPEPEAPKAAPSTRKHEPKKKQHAVR